MQLPNEATRQQILTMEDLNDPQASIDRIFSLSIRPKVETNLDERETTYIVKNVLCRDFAVCPSASFEMDLKKIVFHKMLKEQKTVLDFLEGQKTVAINGAAGTGKTMIALERARRCAERDERVLFLCYNAALRKAVASQAEHDMNNVLSVLENGMKYLQGIKMFSSDRSYVTEISSEEAKEKTEKSMAINKGDTVIHKSFGQGTVNSIQGEHIMVHFNMGIKTFNKQFAFSKGFLKKQ